MKYAILLVVVGLLSLPSLSSPRFVTPAMTDRRNGLTDAQYEFLWSIGRNPSVSQNAARDWAFRASRYQNVTNWLDICGKTNDFAALSYTLQDENFHLEETNAVVCAENVVLVSSNAVLEVDAKKAQKVEKSSAKAKKKDSKNFSKWVSDTEKAKSKSSADMAEFYDAILEIAHAYDDGAAQ